MVQKANTVFRDYVTDGVPSSGYNDPDKAEIRAWGSYVESGIAGASAGATIYDSKADMDADTSQAANAMAWVLGDATAANNGVYQFNGTSTWTRLGDLPYSYITASNAGTGAADAIVATTSISVPAADGGALIALPIVADNIASPVTVTFNGGSALTIKTSSGNDVASGGLTAGMIVAGYVSGSTFRLLTDQSSAAIVAAAEDAATRAEAAASGMEGSPVYATKALAEAITPATAPAFIRTAGYSAAGDGGGALYREVASEPSHAGKLSITLSDGVTVVWYELAEDEPNLLQFGAKADNATSIYSAWQDARGYLGSSGRPLRLLFAGTGIYYNAPSDGALDFRGITVFADPGVSIRGYVRFDADASYGTNIPISYVDAAGLTFSYMLPAADNRRISEKENWLRHGDLDRKVMTALDFNAFSPVKMAFDTDDAWVTDADTSSGTESKTATLANDGMMRATFAPISGGEEMACAFYSGNFVKAAIVRFVGGYVAFYANSGSGTLRTKLVGTAYTENTGLVWFGLADNPAWAPDKVEWKIRVHDVNSWSLVFNGMELFQQSTPGPIVDAGFGLMGVAAATGALSYWTKTKRREPAGQSPMRLLIVGDSKSASQSGSWDKYVKEVLEGSMGQRVWNVYNQAVAGENSTQQLARLTDNTDLATSTHVVIAVGTNDSQGSGPSTTLTNIGSMIDLCNSAGINNGYITLVATDLWYTQTMSGGTGFDAGANDQHALLRAGLKRLAATRGCPLVDLQEVMTAVRPADLSQPLVVDPLVRDNVHPTVYGYKLKADAIAKAILSGAAREMTRRVPTSLIPSSLFKNSWTAYAGREPHYSVSEDGIVVLSGLIAPGTIAEPVVVMNLPANLRPLVTREYYARTTTGSVSTVYVAPDGDVTVSSFPSTGATYLSLDNIVYSLD